MISGSPGAPGIVATAARVPVSRHPAPIKSHDWNSAASALPPVQALQEPSLALVRSTVGPGCHRGRECLAFAQTLAPLDALRRFFVARLCSSGGTATLRQCPHHDLALHRAQGDRKTIPDADRARGFHPLAVDVHLPAGDRLARERAALVETRAPQPLVDAYAAWKEIIAHSDIMPRPGQIGATS